MPNTSGRRRNLLQRVSLFWPHPARMNSMLNYLFSFSFLPFDAAFDARARARAHNLRYQRYIILHLYIYLFLSLYSC
jgi:hypothetical protein